MSILLGNRSALLVTVSLIAAAMSKYHNLCAGSFPEIQSHVHMKYAKEGFFLGEADLPGDGLKQSGLSFV